MARSFSIGFCNAEPLLGLPQLAFELSDASMHRSKVFLSGEI